MRLLTAFTLCVLGVSPILAQEEVERESLGEFDYIVIGSGPGGGPVATNLAKAGFSVLILEAGNDESDNAFTDAAALFGLATLGNTTWDFYVDHYEDMERTLRYNLLTWKQTNGSLYVGTDPPEDAEMLGVYYPRGATLGGSAVVNGRISSLPPDSDWDEIAEITGEKSWNAAEMRQLFEKVENNQYLPEETPGHGFDGWLPLAQGTLDAYDTPAMQAVYGAFAKGFGGEREDALDMISRDANSPDPERDFLPGLFGMAFHGTSDWTRFCSRDILNAAVADGYDLTIQLHSLATKITFDGKKATGVEFFEGAGVYGADHRYTTDFAGTPKSAIARKEVIVSGGAFNSPQLLQLSGIGNCTHLESVGVECLVDLPGVGLNLQENYELPILGNGLEALLPPSDCQMGLSEEEDPCLAEWLANKTGPYSGGGTNTNSLMYMNENAPRGEVDLMAFSFAGGSFRGFYPMSHTNAFPADPPNLFDISTVKIHPRSKAGTVMIQSADPRQQPKINFRLFETGREEDLDAIEETVAKTRKILLDVPEPFGPLELIEPPCTAGVDEETGYCSDREEDREWILDQAFGHHPTCTCPMGSDDDPLAVLDGKFRVRGVEGLRVVDASAFPNVPGAFPVLPTFLISQKATDFILAEMESEEEEESGCDAHH